MKFAGARAGALYAFALVLVASCSAGPSQEDREAASAAASAEVEAAAEQVVGGLAEAHPDVVLTLEPAGSGGYRYWSDCDDLVPGDDGPGRVQWIASRSFVVEPQQAGFDLIAPVADRMEADGWRRVEPFPGVDHVVVLEHDGYRATIGGNREVVEGDVAKVSVQVVSACIDAPDRLGE